MMIAPYKNADNNIIGANFLFNFKSRKLNMIIDVLLKKINQKDDAEIL